VLDTTPPTGHYRLERTSAYLSSANMDLSDIFSGEEGEADFKIIQTDVEAGATRKVVAGDGTPARSWTTGTSFTLTYTKSGVYTPHVLLTDAFGNTRDVALPAVHVIADLTGPAIGITTPARPGQKASWHVIRGTVSDSGTGVAAVGVGVLEKRGRTWWVYDFKKRKWLEGYGSIAKTERKTKASSALVYPSTSGTWRSPVIKGLVKGKLRVEAAAIDNEFNLGVARPVTRRIR
jgi:fructose-specific component phosphotransferase system IIB-like protein